MRVVSVTYTCDVMSSTSVAVLSSIQYDDEIMVKKKVVIIR